MTATAGVGEIGSVPSINYIESWYSKRPRDERFSNVQYVQFNSSVSLDSSNKIEFMLPDTDPPVVYDISDILMKLQLRITTAKGETPAKDKLVFPVNNSALSLFSSMDMRINDVRITVDPGMYNYRCYVQNLVSFDDQSKSSNLYLNGWITDDSELQNGVMGTEPSSTNESMLARNSWFRKDIFRPSTGANKSEYSPDGYTFLTNVKVRQ